MKNDKPTQTFPGELKGPKGFDPMGANSRCPDPSCSRWEFKVIAENSTYSCFLEGKHKTLLTPRQVCNELNRLQNRVKNLESELRNIANAKPSEWGNMSDMFQPWAQTRALEILSENEREETPTND